jgi:hypothetical protein
VAAESAQRADDKAPATKCYLFPCPRHGRLKKPAQNLIVETRPLLGIFGWRAVELSLARSEAVGLRLIHSAGARPTLVCLYERYRRAARPRHKLATREPVPDRVSLHFCARALNFGPNEAYKGEAPVEAWGFMATLQTGHPWTTLQSG